MIHPVIGPVINPVIACTDRPGRQAVTAPR